MCYDQLVQITLLKHSLCYFTTQTVCHQMTADSSRFAGNIWLISQNRNIKRCYRLFKTCKQSTLSQLQTDRGHRQTPAAHRSTQLAGVRPLPAPNDILNGGYDSCYCTKSPWEDTPPRPLTPVEKQFTRPSARQQRPAKRDRALRNSGR